MSDLMWAHADAELLQLEAEGRWGRLSNEELSVELPASEGQDGEVWVGETPRPRLSLSLVLTMIALLLGIIGHVAHK